MLVPGFQPQGPLRLRVGPGQQSLGKSPDGADAEKPAAVLEDRTEVRGWPAVVM